MSTDWLQLARFNYGCVQSCSQSPRSSVGGIVGLWENAEENQPLIGWLIISLTHYAYTVQNNTFTS